MSFCGIRDHTASDPRISFGFDRFFGVYRCWGVQGRSFTRSADSAYLPPRYTNLVYDNSASQAVVSFWYIVKGVFVRNMRSDNWQLSWISDSATLLQRLTRKSFKYVLFIRISSFKNYAIQSRINKIKKKKTFCPKRTNG